MIKEVLTHKHHHIFQGKSKAIAKGGSFARQLDSLEVQQTLIQEPQSSSTSQALPPGLTLIGRIVHLANLFLNELI